MTSDTRTEAERRYDAAALSRPRPTSAPAPAAAPVPAVEVDAWQSDDGVSYSDLVAGEGLTQVTIGNRAPREPGIELLIGGRAINERTADVLTTADLRQLRDNLTALLADPRLQPPAELPPIPVAPAHADEETAWKAPLGSIDGCAVEGIYCDHELLCASLVWRGLPISVYENYLNIQAGAELAFHGDLYFSEWQIIQQLAGRNVVERLQALFAHCKVARVAAA